MWLALSMVFVLAVPVPMYATDREIEVGMFYLGGNMKTRPEKRPEIFMIPNGRNDQTNGFLLTAGYRFNDRFAIAFEEEVSSFRASQYWYKYEGKVNVSDVTNQTKAGGMYMQLVAKVRLSPIKHKSFRHDVIVGVAHWDEFNRSQMLVTIGSTGKEIMNYARGDQYDTGLVIGLSQKLQIRKLGLEFTELGYPRLVTIQKFSDTLNDPAIYKWPATSSGFKLEALATYPVARKLEIVSGLRFSRRYNPEPSSRWYSLNETKKELRFLVGLRLHVSFRD